jgi:uroporphyrin-3 C-methyltransferase
MTSMNQQIPPPESISAAAAAATAAPDVASAAAAADKSGSPPPPSPIPLQKQLQKPLLLASALVLLLVLAAVLYAHSEVRALRSDMANRFRSLDMSTAETHGFAKTAQELVYQLQAKVTILENKQAEAQSQQVALEQLYQDLSKNRDDWALAEIEQVLSTASQQLQLAGNISGALIALQNADRSLSRSDKPQFITIRRAIAKDSERLKALPTVDLTGVALRLDSIISQIDSLPLLSDEKPALAATAPKPVSAHKFKLSNSGKSAEAAGEGRDWAATASNLWQSWSNDMWNEIRQLIRVRSVDTPDALMMAPSQAYFARENVKLRLLNARLALLSRNEAAFRSDLIAAQDAITKYFDTRAKQTQTAQALLKQVQGNNLSIEIPSLSESLNAVRNYKAKP